MDRRYYINPPSLGTPDLPYFIIKHFVKDRLLAAYIQAMIQWAIKEYDASVRTAERQGAKRFAEFLRREYSAMRILCESKAFPKILKQINENNYNMLSGRERVFLRRAADLYTILS